VHPDDNGADDIIIVYILNQPLWNTAVEAAERYVCTNWRVTHSLLTLLLAEADEQQGTELHV
jgi:hypothetical protein